MGNRYALIVGIDYYNDVDHFIPLPSIRAALYELLNSPERSNWSGIENRGHRNIINLSGTAIHPAGA